MSPPGAVLPGVLELADVGETFPAVGLPGIAPRLVVPGTEGGRLALDSERHLGTYGPARTPDLIAELTAAGLRGRGGAAFPAGRKWAAVVEEARRIGTSAVVVANGEEGEPTSAKDRWLLTHRPHLVLDGLLRAAAAVGATRAVLYLAHPPTVAAVEAALAELEAAALRPSALRLDVHVVEPAYVAGEETAACRAISGGPALPLAKPPRPYESGVDSRPTLVANVETLAHAAWIDRHGAAAYRAVGTAASPGTTLVTLVGACARPGVHEIPFGLSLRDLVEQAGGGATTPIRGYVMGGWFGGLLAPDRDGVAFCYDEVRALGSGVGCGAVTVLGEDADPLIVAARIADWYARESAAQCGVCVRGTGAIRDAFAALLDGTATGAEEENLTRWGSRLVRRGACSFLDGAATLARSAVTEFPAVVTAHHLDGGPP